MERIDVYVNNFISTQKEILQNNSIQIKENCIAEFTVYEKDISQNNAQKDNVGNDYQLCDISLNKSTSKFDQNITESNQLIRKQSNIEKEYELQCISLNGKQDSLIEQDSSNDGSSIYNNDNNLIKGLSSSEIFRDISRDQIDFIEEDNNIQNYQDDLNYFQQEYQQQYGVEELKDGKKIKKTFFDQLPEANPIAKRQFLGFEIIKSAYDNPLRDKDPSLINNYMQSFNLATEKPDDFQQCIDRKESLGVKNINAINANIQNGNGNPGLSINLENQSSSNGSQIRQFIYQVFQEDSNLVYLRNPIIANTFQCTFYKMNAIRNDEPYQDFKSKESPEVQQKERLESIIKENLKKPNVLQFESRFESGNLSVASRKAPNEYNLLLQNDINTKGYTQWFFFSVKKCSHNQTVKFNILNFYKNGSLFNEGMKISIFSKKKYDLKNVGWFKGAFEIGYIKNNVVKQNDEYYYTLTFKYAFEYSDDEVYFAYNIPYTYTQLNQFLYKCENDAYKNQFMYRKTLCRTLIGNRLDVITITNPCKDTSVQMIQRKGVVISARVHPGESVSSYIMEGIIEYLLQNTKEANFLRDKFIFKIIPMLNPDGVIHGNYRCSLAGCDLNRRWKNPNQTLHPEIYYSKQMIFDFKKKSDITMIIDIHGHSTKMNVFAYGCHDKKKPFECREFPFILSKINSSFSFKDCNFKVQKNREGTARIALYKSLGIPNIFTVESSFCGPSYINTHFSEEHLKQIGHSICQSILMKFEMLNYQQYIKTIEQNSAPSNIISSEEGKSNENLLENEQEQRNIPQFFNKVFSQQNLTSNKVFLDELYGNPEMIEFGMKNDSGSESEPSGDNMSDSELKKILSNKVKKPKKQLEKNQKESTSLLFQQQSKDIMSQTCTVFKRKTQTNFISKSPEKKPINAPTHQASQTEVKQRAFNFEKSSSPVRSRTMIKNSLYQTGFNFHKNNQNQKSERESSHSQKEIAVLEPKFVYFPLKAPNPYLNIDRLKFSSRESKLKRLNENGQVKQQTANPQSTNRVKQMKLRQNNNNISIENTIKQEVKKTLILHQQITPREFKFDQTIPVSHDNSQNEYAGQSFNGIREAVNVNKSQLGKILRTIMNNQNHEWVYGYQGNNPQQETLNKSLVQEGSQTLTRRQSNQFKQNIGQSQSSIYAVEKSKRSKSNESNQNVFQVQKCNILNMSIYPDQNINNNNKYSFTSLHTQNQFYKPSFIDYRTIQKAKFESHKNSQNQNSLNNSYSTISNCFSKSNVIKPQSAPRTSVRRSLIAHQQTMVGNNIQSNYDSSRQVQNLGQIYYNGWSNSSDLDEKQQQTQGQSTFNPIRNFNN